MANPSTSTATNPTAVTISLNFFLNIGVSSF
jgi:hypothetical protein